MTRKQAVAYWRLFLLLPFFIIALVPRGMMLAPAQNSLSKTLVLCTSDGLRTITLNQAMGLPGDEVADAQESSCPYSLANSAYIDTSGIISIPTISPATLSLLAHYRVQYLITLYPSRFPRGPPAAV